MKPATTKRIFLSLAAAMVCQTAAVAAETAQELGSYQVVDSKEKYRNRTDAVSPTLEYDRKFFERFEPVTVGDMLKRVPGVVFKGDIGEYDFIQFRGLPSAYTQVLINGKRVPGNDADRGVNFDRIPAEMVERVEIIRSPSAELDSQGSAGIVNIILKDGATLPGTAYRVGVSRHSNGKDNPWTETMYKPNVFLSHSDNLETFSYTVSAYYQERYNSKDKVTNEHEDGEDDKASWVYTEDEWDSRHSKDLSFYTRFDIDLSENQRMIVSANSFQTTREENQYEFKQERDAVTDPFELQKIEHQIMNIDQSSLDLDVEYIHSLDNLDEVSVGVSFATFDGTLEEIEAKEKTDDRAQWKTIESVRNADHSTEYTDTEDKELKLEAAYAYNQMDAHKMKFGIQTQLKNRDVEFTSYDVEDGVAAEADTESLGTHKIDETRVDLFASDRWTLNSTSDLQLGARIETTGVDQEGTEGDKSNDYTFFNPSVHYKLALSDQEQLRVSLAQTLRRPNFDDMVPFEADDEPSDYDVLTGNPELQPEKILGLDLGYERAFADQFGIIGVNFFYRSVSDKIENRYLGVNTVEDDGETFTGGKYTPDNIGDGTAQGLELDASFPLTFIGAPSVNFFANYSYLDSSIEDPYTKKDRRFNDQPDYVYNLGLNHTLKEAGVSYGFSYQKRGDSTAEDPVTTEVTSYDANLEAYVEYLVSDDMTLRVTGDNLLDADVTEHMKNYESLADKLAGNVDTYETQIERAGAVFMVTLSGRF